MTKITSVRQNTNNSIFHFLNKKRPQDSHQCDNEYIFCISNNTLIIVSISTRIKTDHKIHINVNIITFFYI